MKTILFFAGNLFLASAALAIPVATGLEFKINTYSTNPQDHPAVATAPDGRFVVVWQSSLQDLSDYGIYFQRYTAAGVPDGIETKVNTYTTNGQTTPVVAISSSGSFVVAWTSNSQDGASGGIYSQRFSALGVPAGTETRVNTHITGDEVLPAVGMDSTGNYTIVWESKTSQDGGSGGIYGQRYDSAGTPIGTEFLVNTNTISDQGAPTIAMNPSGAFVVAWESRTSQDGDSSGVYFQRYNAAGTKVGTETRANTRTISDQRDASVGIDDAGNFVVAWEGGGAQDGDSFGVYAQRYAAAGTTLGSEFKVNTYTLGNQWNPSVTVSSGGYFVIAWESSLQESGAAGVYLQQYNAAGVAQGIETKVNTYALNDQGSPSVSSNSAGEFNVVWESRGVQDSGTAGVYGQRFALATPSTTFKITSVGFSGNDLQLGFPSEAGKTYRVEQSTNLLNWSPLGSDLAGTGSNLTATDPGAKLTIPRKFYRAKTVAP